MTTKIKTTTKTETKTKTNTNTKTNTKTKTKFVSLDVLGNKIVKGGDVEPNGDIRTKPGHRILFEYPVGPETFALFIVSLETPFDATVYATDSGWLALNVKQLAKKGSYDYRLALVDSNGNIVTNDPQIIVE